MLLPRSRACTHTHTHTHRNVSRVKKLNVGPQDLQRLVAKGQDAIDLILVRRLVCVWVALWRELGCVVS